MSRKSLGLHFLFPFVEDDIVAAAMDEETEELKFVEEDGEEEEGEGEGGLSAIRLLLFFFLHNRM